MIQYPEKAFDIRIKKGMVQGGGKKKRDQGGAIDAKRYYLPSVIDAGSVYYQYHQSSYCQSHSNTMSDGIGNLFFATLFGTQRNAVQVSMLAQICLAVEIADSEFEVFRDQAGNGFIPRYSLPDF